MKSCALPGIGRSTAGAILALSRGRASPDPRWQRQARAGALLRRRRISGRRGGRAARCGRSRRPARRSEHVAEYTQGIMDLGATICTRARPACLLCPVTADCVARERETCRTGCRRRGRASAGPQREAWLVVAMRGAHKVLLERRPPAGIWGGLWGLPEFPTRAACGAMVPRAPVRARRSRTQACRCATRSATSTTRCGRSSCIASARRRNCATTIATAGTTSRAGEGRTAEADRDADRTRTQRRSDESPDDRTRSRSVRPALHRGGRAADAARRDPRCVRRAPARRPARAEAARELPDRRAVPAAARAGAACWSGWSAQVGGRRARLRWSAR